jgi:DNA-binding NarL/FixJ family response regulator
MHLIVNPARKECYHQNEMKGSQEMINQSATLAWDDRTIRVLVVDDHTLIAETVVAALSSENDMTIETAKDINETEGLIRTKGRFDVVLLDYDLPDTNALEGLKRVMDLNSGGVALFSGVANWTVVERALAMGAKGFIPKTLPLRTVAHALRFIADDEVYVPADFALQIGKGSGGTVGLKPREVRVLSFLNEGLQNKEIARHVGIEETIVKMDVKSICRKLGARNRTQAVLAARKQGLV